jgi:hypothetical protein
LFRRITVALAACAAFCLPAQAATLGYDPKADPFEQYHEAIATAEARGKLVLVIAGGDWCTWCHVLDRFLERNDDVRTRLEDAFVVMKVYVGDENYNEAFFEQLPRAYGAPHFWIVSPDRVVLASQATGALERGKRSYDKEEFLSFIQRWRQHADHRHSLAQEWGSSEAASF